MLTHHVRIRTKILLTSCRIFPRPPTLLQLLQAPRAQRMYVKRLNMIAYTNVVLCFLACRTIPTENVYSHNILLVIHSGRHKGRVRRCAIFYGRESNTWLFAWWAVLQVETSTEQATLPTRYQKVWLQGTHRHSAMHTISRLCYCKHKWGPLDGPEN